MPRHRRRVNPKTHERSSQRSPRHGYAIGTGIAPSFFRQMLEATPANDSQPSHCRGGFGPVHPTPPCLQCKHFHLTWLNCHSLEFLYHGLSSTRGPGIQQSKGCVGLSNDGRAICEETAAVRDGGGALPLCNRPAPQTGPIWNHTPASCSLRNSTVFCVSPGCRLSSPRGLRAFPAQSGGTTGGSSARMGTNGQVQGEA